MVRTDSGIRKPAVSLLLVLLMVLSLVAWVPVKSAATHPGSGTEADPYEIDSLADLENIDEDWTGYYVLTQDINATGQTYNAPDGPFNGTLDGQGHEIINLDVSDSGDGFRNGLFQRIDNTDASNPAVIKDLHVDFDDPDTSESNYGVVGLTQFGTVHFRNVTVSGTIVGTGQNQVAAFVGQVRDNSIIYVNDSVVKDFHIDAGSNFNSAYVAGRAIETSEIHVRNLTVKDSRIDGGPTVGGAIGVIDHDDVKVRVEDYKMVNITQVTTDDYLGGVIAESVASDVRVQDVNMTDVELDGSRFVGGLVGRTIGGSTLRTYHFDDVEMNNVEANAQSDFGSLGVAIWEGSSNSVTHYNNTHVTDGYVEANFYSGGFFGRAYSGTKYIRDSTFQGRVGGQNREIGGLIGGAAGGEFEGYDGYSVIRNTTFKGTVENVNIRSGTGGEIGGFIGQADAGDPNPPPIKIINSGFEGTVDHQDEDLADSNLDGTQVGGMIGYITGDSGDSEPTVIIRGSYVKGRVTTIGTAVGGMVGQGDDVKIVDSYVLADVNGDLAGDVDNTEHAGIGGFVGQSESSSTVINKSYFAGEITGPGFKGGVVGVGKVSDPTVNQVYWDRELAGVDGDTSGFIADEDLTGAEALTTDEATTKDAYDGFNFWNVWARDDLHNDRYPWLVWEDLGRRDPSTVNEEFDFSDFLPAAADSAPVFNRSSGEITIPSSNELIERALSSIGAIFGRVDGWSQRAGDLKDTLSLIFAEQPTDPDSLSSGFMETYNDRNATVHSYLNAKTNATTKLDAVMITFKGEDETSTVYWVADIRNGDYNRSKVVTDTSRDIDHEIELCGPAARGFNDEFEYFVEDYVFLNKPIPKSEMVRFKTRYGDNVGTTFGGQSHCEA